MLATKVQHLVIIYSRVHKTYQITNTTMLSRKIEWRTFKSQIKPPTFES